MAEAPAVGRAKGRAGIIAFLLTALFIFLAVEQIQPPAPVPASAPAKEFSSARALTQLRVIAQKPRPTGSEENARVRAYLVQRLKTLGFDVQVQTATAVRYETRGEHSHHPATAATVNNIVARRKGLESSRDVMLAAHYDSVPTGPGASDDGSGVATLLETARTLHGEPLLNNLDIVLTDGEELGLLGAKAFVEQNPWIGKVGVVLNFEARGTCGPSVMFETSRDNGLLIRTFSAANSHAVSNSAMLEAYKRLPNDTDLTIFKRAGMPGMNYAYVGCWPRYHSARDDLADLSPRSLQHDGVQALALARRFGNLDLTRPQASAKDYFSLFGHVIDYPESWSLPMTLLALLLFGAVAGFGLRKRLLSVRGMLFGWVIWLAAATVAAALSQGSWNVLRAKKLVALLPYGMPYHGTLLAYGFVALTVAVMAAVYGSLRRMRVGNLTVGALAWWAILAVFTALKAPGANFLFLWPLLASSLELLYAFKQKDPEREEKSVLVWTFPALTGILIFSPLLFLLVMLVSTTVLVVVVAATALLIGLLVPMVHIMTAQRRWLLAGGALAACLICIGAALTRSSYSARDPRADSIFYAQDADTGKAVWVSADRAPDPWTWKFLRGGLTQSNLNVFLPLDESVVEHPAPAIQLTPPQGDVLEDATTAGVRTLSLRVTSPRHARVMWVTLEKGRVTAASVNGRPIPQESSARESARWGLVYTNLPEEGIVLKLQVTAGEPLKLRLTDQADGLPQIPGRIFQPRPPDLMPSPAVPFDSTTMVSKTLLWRGVAGRLAPDAGDP